MSTLITFIKHSFGNPSHRNQKKKEKKEIQIEKEVTLSLFSDDIENPKNSSIYRCIKNQKTKTKETKSLGINLPGETKDLYSKNCKMLVKETEDDTNTQTGESCYIFFFLFKIWYGFGGFRCMNTYLFYNMP